MSKGPCLCGDPYCARCGNPSAAEAEELFEKLTDVMWQNVEPPFIRWLVDNWNKVQDIYMEGYNQGVKDSQHHQDVVMQEIQEQLFALKEDTVGAQETDSAIDQVISLLGGKK